MSKKEITVHMSITLPVAAKIRINVPDDATTVAWDDLEVTRIEVDNMQAHGPSALAEHNDDETIDVVVDKVNEALRRKA